MCRGTPDNALTFLRLQELRRFRCLLTCLRAFSPHGLMLARSIVIAEANNGLKLFSLSVVIDRRQRFHGSVLRFSPELARKGALRHGAHERTIRFAFYRFRALGLDLETLAGRAGSWGHDGAEDEIAIFD